MTPCGEQNYELDLLVFGEFFFDLVFYHLPDQPRLGEEVKTDCFSESPGGGLATTAITAHRLGTKSAILTRVGGDAVGRTAWKELASSGLDISAVEVQTSFTTAITVCIAYDNDRMMVTHEPINVQLEDMLDNPAVIQKLKSSRHIHIACALRQPQKWISILSELRAQGTTISADLGWNPDISIRDLLPVLLLCDFIFPNELEALAATGTSNAGEAISRLAEWVSFPVIKLGRRGSMMLANEEMHHQPALDLAVVDATGAGDAFNGGFLHAYLQGWDWDDCLRAGNICGGLAATAAGGSKGLPDRDQFELELKEMKKMHSSPDSATKHSSDVYMNSPKGKK